MLNQPEGYHQVLRKPANLDVTIYCHSFPFAKRKARDIGPEGMFIETDPLNFTRNTYLEVEFELDKSIGSRLYRLHVYVGDTTDDGIDLLFFDNYIAAFEPVKANPVSAVNSLSY